MRERERGGALSKRALAQRILLIQPDPVLGLALSRFLADTFAQVAVATSVPTALGMLRGHPHYDAIVLDEASSDDLGHTVAALITVDPALAQRIVLLCDAPPPSPLRGVHEVLLKPAPGGLLLSAIDGCLGPGLHKVTPRIRVPREESAPKSR